MPDSRPLLALLGFTPFERRSMQAFFELAREQGPSYGYTDDLRHADCAVADADDRHAMALLQQAGALRERTVLLGKKRHDGVALQLPRPINLLLVMRALDTLVGARPRAGTRLAQMADEPPPAPRVAPRLMALPEAAEAARTPDTGAAATLASAADAADSADATDAPGAPAAPAAPHADGGEFKAVAGTSQAPRVDSRASAAATPPTPPPGTRLAADDVAPTPAPRTSHVQRVLDELAMRTATLPPNIDVRALAAQGAHEATRPARGRPRERDGRDARGMPDAHDATDAHLTHGSHHPRAAHDSPGAAAAARGRDLVLDPLARARSDTRHTPLPMEHILVIDHDASTLRLVAVQLQRFGFQIHLVGHPDDAMRLLTKRFHEYVFMDPALPGLDALLACRLARQYPPPGDACATTVVLLADPGAPAAPLERALPAADACLKKPIDRHALLKLVGEREVARVAYADTARTTTII